MSVVMDRGMPRQKITVDEYYRMAEQGLLAPDARVELIEGEIIDMPPMGSLHAGNASYVSSELILALKDRATVFTQCTLCLDELSAPEPDIYVCKYREDFYERKLPTPAETYLVIEVSNSTLSTDRSFKAPLYARAGIPEYWIFDVKSHRIEMYRTPADGMYRDVVTLTKPRPISIQLLPDVEIDLSRFFQRGQSTTSL